ncbi:MAG TPA: hypothetical protein VGB73_04290 [Pyrinomonadaceae bacterium]|jgi:hypothetical protein
MASKKEESKPKRRTQVKELPKEERELSKDEQKKVKGGSFNLQQIQQTLK